MNNGKINAPTPKVSVIVPNYNHGRFLQCRLDSILQQTFPDFELIFLDDASSDNSREVFEKYKADSRITSQFNATNSGSPFVQWNRGFELARGEFVWIAESDDYCEKEFLKTLVDALDAQPEAGVAYTQSWVVSENGEKLYLVDWYNVYGNEERWNDDFVNRGRDELARYMGIQNTIPNASAVLFRRSLLGKGMRAPENMQLCGDWFFWVSLLLESDVVYVSEPLNCFRMAHTGSQRHLSETSGKEVTETLQVQSQILEKVKPRFKQRMRMLRRVLRRWASLSSHQGLSRSFSTQFRQDVRDVYCGGGGAHLAERMIIGFYYYLIVPGVKSLLYKSTLGCLRAHLYNRKHGHLPGK